MCEPYPQLPQLAATTGIPKENKGAVNQRLRVPENKNPFDERKESWYALTGNRR